MQYTDIRLTLTSSNNLLKKSIYQIIYLHIYMNYFDNTN